MSNFFTGNADLMFRFENLDIEEQVAIREDDYTQAEHFDYAPESYEDAIDNYRRVLEMVGELTADLIAPRAAEVDIEGNTLIDGKVRYAKGIQQALDELKAAELMGATLPREFGGLNFPTSVHMMTTEMIARADASLMNLYLLQDIAETICKYGSDEQREEFVPRLANGECTGAMVLTEPDAGSDLQAIKLHAYQDEDGNWFLRGVKRFITNGCGDILLVLARSESDTQGARGLSLFVCYGGDTVKVRRIEHKLGIHGSPTCELQFEDTPAQLVGQRKFGLVRYVMDLMNGARLGIAAQAIGIAQAAYEEAVKYASARVQFGTAIRDIPPVTNMLIEMRVALESHRALLYSTAQWVDLADGLAERVAKLKERGEPYAEDRKRMREAEGIAALLTPLSKYFLTESANRITYDALQVHGGTGYMQEFNVERHTRDARITSIYEGTSQLQIVGAYGGVLRDVLGPLFAAKEENSYPADLKEAADRLKTMRTLFREAAAHVEDQDDRAISDVAAKELVEMYGLLYMGYLLLDDAERDERRKLIANRFATNALATSRKNFELIVGNQFGDLEKAGEILG
jgi:alkylation response protein AidB-like acyl-CoA dehydrogenase